MRNRRIVERPQTTVVGIEVRTANKWESNADSARIPALWNQFYGEGVPDRVPHKSGDGHLIVFTSERGPVVEAVQTAWKTIWSMTPEQLGGQRSFSADFEIFDSRSADFSDGEVDIYVSVK